MSAAQEAKTPRKSHACPYLQDPAEAKRPTASTRMRNDSPKSALVINPNLVLLFRESRDGPAPGPSGALPLTCRPATRFQPIDNTMEFLRPEWQVQRLVRRRFHGTSTTNFGPVSVHSSYRHVGGPDSLSMPHDRNSLLSRLNVNP